MGKYKDLLDKALTASENYNQDLKKTCQVFDKCSKAAAESISTYADLKKQLNKTTDQMLAQAELFGRAAAELMVYEDDLAAAKKAKDKDEMKAIEKKMKPLISKANKAQAAHGKLQPTFEAQLNSLITSAGPLAQIATTASKLKFG